MIRGFGTVSMHGKEVRVFMNERGLNLFRSLEDVNRQPNGVTSVVGNACRRTVGSPLDYRLCGEGESTVEVVEKRLGE